MYKLFVQPYSCNTVSLTQNLNGYSYTLKVLARDAACVMTPQLESILDISPSGG